MVDEISLAIAIAALVVSIGAIIPLYLDYFARRAEKRRIDLEVERVKYDSTSPIESEWTIRIVHPTKAIEHCSVEIQWANGAKDWLPIGDRTTKIYDIKIPKGDGLSFRVPKGSEPSISKIIVKDGEKTIFKRNFRDLPLTNP